LKSSTATNSFDREGAVRVLGYVNHADAGNYAQAVKIAAQTGH
jgi:hypothetical protein